MVEEIENQRAQFHYKLEGSKVKFDASVLEAHRKLKFAIFPWLRSSTLRSIVSMPFIYGMTIPLVFMDVSISLYQ